jgi:outer membrane protein assembly factor BamB
VPAWPNDCPRFRCPSLTESSGDRLRGEVRPDHVGLSPVSPLLPASGLLCSFLFAHFSVLFALCSLLIAHCSALAQRRRVYVSGKPAAPWSTRRGRSGKIQRHEMEVSYARMLIGSPVVMEDGGKDLFGQYGKVYSLHATSGALHWKFRTGMWCTPLQQLRTARCSSSVGTNISMPLRGIDGHEPGRFKTGEDPDTHNHIWVQSSAAVLGVTVYFGCPDSHLYAL